MRNFTLVMVLVLLLSACEKDPAKELSSDFVIKRYREYPGGNTTLDVERALNLDDATHFNAQITKTDKDIILQLGGVKVTSVEPKLWASIVFYSKSDPRSIVGMYTFPAAQSAVEVYFLENTSSGFYGRSLPASGVLTVNYDAVTNTYYGEIQKLKYGIPYRADYTYEEFNATFKQVKFR